MKLSLLLAEPRDILRAGLHTIFISDERVEHIYEASSKESLQTSLRTISLDLVIANQSLISDVTSLPAGRFVILAAELDLELFQAAYRQGARGYLQENTSKELLQATLSLSEGAFLIEPTMAAYIVDYLSGDQHFIVKEELLTPREKEVVSLLREGIDRHTIAKRLSISEATLKTHIKNIVRKR